MTTEKTTVLVARGIGDTGMLQNVTKHLNPDRFRAVDVPWGATYGPIGGPPNGLAFLNAVEHGIAELWKLVAEAPGRVVIIGYSGGAAVAGHFASTYAQGRYPELDNKIVAVALIADPYMPAKFSSRGHAWGIAGQRHINASKKFWLWQISDPADVISNCPPNSPLRTIADQSAAFSLADPRAWAEDIVARLLTNRWQEISPLRFWKLHEIFGRFNEAIGDARGYLTGDHTSYHLRRYPGSTRTYTEWLADRINEIAK